MGGGRKKGGAQATSAGPSAPSLPPSTGDRSTAPSSFQDDTVIYPATPFDTFVRFLAPLYLVLESVFFFFSFLKPVLGCPRCGSECSVLQSRWELLSHRGRGQDCEGVECEAGLE